MVHLFNYRCRLLTFIVVGQNRGVEHGHVLNATMLPNTNILPAAVKTLDQGCHQLGIINWVSSPEHHHPSIITRVSSPEYRHLYIFIYIYIYRYIYIFIYLLTYWANVLYMYIVMYYHLFRATQCNVVADFFN